MTIDNDIIRFILKSHNQGKTERNIANIYGVSKGYAGNIIRSAKNINLNNSLLETISDDELQNLLFPKSSKIKIYQTPDFNKYIELLKGKKFTIQYLYELYNNDCQLNNEISCSQRTLYRLYSDYKAKNIKPTMSMLYSPGDVIQIDWAGKKVKIRMVDGTFITVSLFVAILPYSGYTYVQATHNEQIESFIHATINALKFFDGVPCSIVTDNLKCAISSNKSRYSIINTQFQRFAKHYDVYISPTRVRKPQDKAKVEKAVKDATRIELSRCLEDLCFNTIDEINKYIISYLDKFNNRKYQNSQISRHDLYVSEKNSLKPLPEYDYKIVYISNQKISKNYLVKYKSNYYSVPYQYINKQVSVIVSDQNLDVFYNNRKIAHHIIVPGEMLTKKVLPEHMNDAHHHVHTMSKLEFENEAGKKIGLNAKEAMRRLLENQTIHNQGYRTGDGFLKLINEHDKLTIDKACEVMINKNLEISFDMLLVYIDLIKNKQSTDLSINDEHSPKNQDIPFYKLKGKTETM
jgi:transposase